jgi:hypothetical protein
MLACKVDTNIELLVFSICAKDKLKGQKLQNMTCHTKSLAMTPLGKAPV